LNALTSENSAPNASLDVPKWVPEAVNRRAQDLRAKTNSAELIAILQHLVVAPRMRDVWTELTKHQRKKSRTTESFLYPARVQSAATTAAQRQDEAMATLFEAIVQLAANGIDIFVRAKSHPKKNKWNKMAFRLREDAAYVRDTGDLSRSERLLDAALAYDELTNPLQDTDELLNDQDRVLRLEEREFAIHLARKFHSLFGSGLYRTTATLTSVILKREVKPNTVTEWCRGLWGKSVKKKK
jgi:hypothetical protein